MTKRRFGRVRKLPSGRWQARYPGPDGIDRPAPETFGTKTDANVWLTLKEAEIRNGGWIDPGAGAVFVVDFGSTWIDERPGLRPKTIRLYRYLLRAPTLRRTSRASLLVRSPSRGSAAGARSYWTRARVRSRRLRHTV